MKKTIATFSISMMIILIVIMICGCHSQSYTPIATYLDQDLGAIVTGPDGNVWFTEPYANEMLLSSDYVSLIVQRFCQYPLIKIGSKFPFPGMTG